MNHAPKKSAILVAPSDTSQELIERLRVKLGVSEIAGWATTTAEAFTVLKGLGEVLVDTVVVTAVSLHTPEGNLWKGGGYMVAEVVALWQHAPTFVFIDDGTVPELLVDYARHMGHEMLKLERAAA